MVYSLNPPHGIYLQCSETNPSVISKSYHLTALSYLNNDQALQNVHKIILIAKPIDFTYYLKQFLSI